MRVTGTVYGDVELSPLDEALFGSVADELERPIEEVARKLLGLHGVPSDNFYAAFDYEVSVLRDRFEATE